MIGDASQHSPKFFSPILCSSLLANFFYYQSFYCTVFYLTPLQKKPGNPSKPWFTLTPVGKNCLNTFLKEMWVAAGLSKYHNLQAYGTTAMLRVGIPEKLIQQHTGHGSIDTLQKYERTSESQLLEMLY